MRFFVFPGVFLAAISCGSFTGPDGSYGSSSSQPQVQVESQDFTTVSGRVGGAFDIEVTWRGLDGSEISKLSFPNSEAFYTTMYNTFKAKYSQLRADPKNGIQGGPSSATDSTWSVKLNAQTGLADLHENMLVYVEPADNVGIPKLQGSNRVLSDRTFSFQVANDLDSKVYRLRATKSIDVTLTSTDPNVPPVKACYIFSARENATFGSLKKGVNITKFEVMITAYQCQVGSSDPWGSVELPTSSPSKQFTVEPTETPVVTTTPQPIVTASPQPIIVVTVLPQPTALPTPSDLSVEQVSLASNWKFTENSVLSGTGFGPDRLVSSDSNYCIAWSTVLPVSSWAATRWKARIVTPIETIEGQIGYVYSCSDRLGEYRLELFKPDMVTPIVAHRITKTAR